MLLRRLQAQLRDKPPQRTVVMSHADYSDIRDHLMESHPGVWHSVARYVGAQLIRIDDRVPLGTALMTPYRPEPLDRWSETVPQSIQAFAVADAPTLPEAQCPTRTTT